MRSSAPHERRNTNESVRSKTTTTIHRGRKIVEWVIGTQPHESKRTYPSTAVFHSRQSKVLRVFLVATSCTLPVHSVIDRFAPPVCCLQWRDRQIIFPTSHQLLGCDVKLRLTTKNCAWIECEKPSLAASSSHTELYVAIPIQAELHTVVLRNKQQSSSVARLLLAILMLPDLERVPQIARILCTILKLGMKTRL